MTNNTTSIADMCDQLGQFANQDYYWRTTKFAELKKQIMAASRPDMHPVLQLAIRRLWTCRADDLAQLNRCIDMVFEACDERYAIRPPICLAAA